jgi:redox-sensitive bicupin YhaK (pirin superfamily)
MREEKGLVVRVFSGQSVNAKGPASNHMPVTMLDFHFINAGASLMQIIPPGEEGFVFVLSGQGQFGLNGTSIKDGQIGHLSKTNPKDGPTSLTVVANKEPLRFLLLTWQPLHQRVVAHGPFVMNTKDQIGEAFEDCRAGAFGSIPKGSSI